MTRIHKHELTDLEVAAGVTLEMVADVLPKAALRNGQAIMPLHTPPALAGSVARCMFGAPAEYDGRNKLGLPVYNRAV